MPKKVLHLMPCFTTGGAERLVLQYFRGLNPEKYTVYVGSTVEDGPFRTQFKEQSRLFIGSRKYLCGRFAVWRALREYVYDLKPDIIHTHLDSGDWFGWLLKRRLGNRMRWVSTLHNVEYHTAWWRKMIWREILPQADKIIAVSETVADYARHALSVPTTKLVVIENGIELAPWVAVPSETVLKTSTFRLATIGRLEKQKGQAVLFSALAKLTDVPWQLTVYGKGSEQEQLIVLAQRLKINDRIKWAGEVFDMPERLKEVDVVVQPSWWEGRSLVVLEAMAAARVVVASIPAAEGIIEPGVTGWVVPPGDQAALAKALRFIFAHQEEARAAALAGRERAQDYFGVDKHLIAIEALYAGLL